MKDIVLKVITNESMCLEKIQRLTGISDEELKNIIAELAEERLIFLNTSNKYEVLSNEYHVGTLEKTSKGVYYIMVGDYKIDISTANLHTAQKHDLVVVEEKYNHSGFVKGIEKRQNNNIVCEVREWKNKLILVPFNNHKDIHLITPPELLKDCIVGDRVYITLTNESSQSNDLKVRNITKIGNYNDELNDEYSIAISKGFDIEFSEEAMKEAEAIPDKVLPTDKEGRLDLTGENIFTIDSIHTKDMDDAISIKKLPNGNLQLSVHIADVSHYVKPGMQLFKEAIMRGTSLYLGDAVIPMLPPKLSNGICSLNEGEERLAKSCIMEIDRKGNVVEYDIKNTVIKSKKKMTYEDLNELFKVEMVDLSYIPFIQDLNHMRRLSRVLSKQKEKDGFLGFASNDLRIKKDVLGDNKVLSFEDRKQDEAENIIENFMVLANEVVATEFALRELPFIFRVHDVPKAMKLVETLKQIKELGLGQKLTRIQNAYGNKAIQDILNEYRDSPNFAVISNLLLRSMAKAKYSTNNIGHFATAKDYYCHFTSPIRRGADLIVHILVDWFNNDVDIYDKLDLLSAELAEIANHVSYKERQADDAEKEYMKLKMAKYMLEHKDEEFDGIILDIDKDDVYIKLDNNIKCCLDRNGIFAQSFYADQHKKILRYQYGKQEVRLGSRVTINVTRVDTSENEIFVDIKGIEKIDKQTNKENKVKAKRRKWCQDNRG